MTDNMTRRAMLAAAPFAMAGAATASPLLAKTGDPHPEWLKAYITNERAIEAGKFKEGSDEDKRIWAERDQLEDLICTTPVTTITGLAAQLEFLVREGKDYWCCPQHGELAEDLVRTAKHLAHTPMMVRGQ